MNTKTRKTGARLGALLLSLCLMMGLLPMTAFAKAVVRDTYNIYSDEAVAGGADSQVYAVTIEDVDGEDLHYVYSPNVPHVIDLMDQIRAGLSEPYKSLVPTFEDNDPFSTGFLCFSENQELYAAMNLDWDNPEDVANTLVSGSGSVSVAANDSAISVTDISVTHAGKDVLSKTQFQAIVAGGADNYTGPSEFSQLKSGKNRVERQWTTTACAETVEGIEYFDVFDTMHVTQISACTATKEEEGTVPTKRKTYHVYSDEVIAGGSDTQVYAVTIKDESGEDLHYVYSPNVNSNASIEKIREGLKEPYKSLILNFDEETFNNGFLRFSRDQDKYENMKLNWADVRTVAATLIYKEGGVSAVSNDSAVSVTDISVTHADEKVVSVKQFSAEDFYTNPPEFSQLASGKNRVEVMVGVTYCTETVEGKAYYDVFNNMHVTQIYAYTATKTASVSDPITLPVRVLEEGDVDYSPAPELSATFTPNTAVTVGEFNEWQGLAIDYYNPMVDAELSEGYDIQAGYTVSIPLTDYEGETLSGTLTIPLPKGYDGATARIKNGAAASSYTATTVSFPVTLDVSYGTAEALELLIEYAAQTGGDDQTGGSDQTGSDTTPQRPDRNGGGGSSSLYQDRELDFWEDVKSNLEDAEPGDTVKANARTYDRMPWSVMEALRNSDNVTLHIIWNGGEDIIIPSEAALSEQSRVYYPLSYLEEMTFEVEPEVPAADLDKINPETGGILTETPELAEKGIEQPLPGVYEPEEATASPAEETGTNGLLIASAVVALAAAGGGFWYWKRRTVR